VLILIYALIMFHIFYNLVDPKKIEEEVEEF